MLDKILTPGVVHALWLTLAALLTVLTPVLAFHARRALKKVYELAGVVLEETQLKKLDAFVMMGIGSADEYAHNAAKHALDFSSHDKLEHAVKVARDLAPDSLHAYNDEQLKAVVEATLPVARARMSTRPPPPPSG